MKICGFCLAIIGPQFQALVACKLYRAMAHEADQDDLEIELSEEFRSYSK